MKTKHHRILQTQEIKQADSELLQEGFTADEVEALRSIQRRRGCNPEYERVRVVEVSSKGANVVADLIDLAYDPLSITFLLFESRGQTHVMCLVGELVTNQDWNESGVVRSMFRKAWAAERAGKKTEVWGAATSGKPTDVRQFAEDIARIPAQGKIPTSVVIEAIGNVPKLPVSLQKRVEKRLKRAQE